MATTKKKKTKRVVRAKTKTKKPAKTTAKAATRRARKSRPPKAGPVNEWMELRDSPIHGLGAFALQDIPKGQRITGSVGEKISNAEADRRSDDDTMKSHPPFSSSSTASSVSTR